MECGCSEEKLMQQIMEYKFAITDISLFLDTHPCDEKALSLHNEYVSEFQKLKEKYENEYGPLSIETEMDSWKWIENKWPWENGGDK